MSHEIRTPLNAVIGFAEILMDTPINDEQREGLEIIKARSMDLVSIINDILDLAKIEAGRLDISSCEFDLRGTVEDAFELFRAIAKIKSLGLECHVAEDVPALWMGDPIRIKQILVNLIGNAIKFSEKGCVTVTVSRPPSALSALSDQPDNRQPATSRTPRPPHLLFSIADTGIGIPTDKLDLIFHEFTQADGTHARKYGGTGLGLTICERLCRLMGGMIWVESAPGKGSVFYFTVPLSAHGTPAVETPGTVKPLESSAIRVLVVEDDPYSARVAERHVSSFGGTTTIAETGKQALDLLALRHADFDLVLLDLQMPDTDGLSVSRTVRTFERERGLPQIALVAMTANAMPEDKASSLAAGMDAHIAKPVAKDALHAILAMVASKLRQPIPGETPVTGRAVQS